MKKSYDRITMTFEKLNTVRVKNIAKMSKSDFNRDRKMPFSEIIKCILNKEGKTTTMEINNYFKKLIKENNGFQNKHFARKM